MCFNFSFSLKFITPHKKIQLYIFLKKEKKCIHTRMTGVMCATTTVEKNIINIDLKIAKMLSQSSIISNEINKYITAQPSTEVEKLYTS